MTAVIVNEGKASPIEVQDVYRIEVDGDDVEICGENGIYYANVNEDEIKLKP